jgi:hypothetical protein
MIKRLKVTRHDKKSVYIILNNICTYWETSRGTHIVFAGGMYLDVKDDILTISMELDNA